ncbi:hypothetical protein SO802_012487 [Lithocarpus litseifolius]|uniref:Uncharacterized protein n=1 Tax=Lithocarpus litseifolius TaxID=425828 RepID=A0AAW2D8B7_9ROSI
MIPLLQSKPNVQTNVPLKSLLAWGRRLPRKWIRASDMTIVLQEYTALARERFNKKKGKSMGSSEHAAQSTCSGNLRSLRRALKVMNQYNDLDDDTYINTFEGRMVSFNDPFWTFDHTRPPDIMLINSRGAKGN